jgi:hypothetical protein
MKNKLIVNDCYSSDELFVRETAQRHESGRVSSCRREERERERRRRRVIERNQIKNEVINE